MIFKLLPLVFIKLNRVYLVGIPIPRSHSFLVGLYVNQTPVKGVRDKFKSYLLRLIMILDKLLF